MMTPQKPPKLPTIEMRKEVGDMMSLDKEVKNLEAQAKLAAWKAKADKRHTDPNLRNYDTKEELVRMSADARDLAFVQNIAAASL